MSEDEPKTSNGRLPLRTLLCYSSSMVGLLGVTTMVAVHLMYFYNTVVMLPAIVVGVVGVAIAGEDGLLERHALKRRQILLEDRVGVLEIENALLRAEVHRVQTDPRVARRAAAAALLQAPEGSTLYRFAGSADKR